MRAGLYRPRSKCETCLDIEPRRHLVPVVACDRRNWCVRELPCSHSVKATLTPCLDISRRRDHDHCWLLQHLSFAYLPLDCHSDSSHVVLNAAPARTPISEAVHPNNLSECTRALSVNRCSYALHLARVKPRKIRRATASLSSISALVCPRRDFGSWSRDAEAFACAELPDRRETR